MPAAVLLSSHSELDPPLPIPNRAVKRLSADDSADYPCESRTLLGSLFTEKPSSRGLFCLWHTVTVIAGTATVGSALLRRFLCARNSAQVYPARYRHSLVSSRWHSVVVSRCMLFKFLRSGYCFFSRFKC